MQTTASVISYQQAWRLLHVKKNSDQPGLQNRSHKDNETLLCVLE